METTYRLNTRELDTGLISAIKDTYPDSDIEIVVREDGATDYLLSSPVNREHLEKSINDIEKGHKILSFETLEAAILSARSGN